MQGALAASFSIDELKLAVKQRKTRQLKELLITRNDQLWAVKRLQMMRLIHEDGVDPNTNGWGHRLLFDGLWHNDTQVVECCLEHGANLRIKDGAGDPVLFYARSLGMAQRLVGHGANIHAEGNGRRNVLHQIILGSDGKLNLIKYYCGLGIRADLQDKWGNTPLHDLFLRTAGEINTASKARAILLAGGDLDVQNKAGTTARERLRRLDDGMLLAKVSTFDRNLEIRKLNEVASFLGESDDISRIVLSYTRSSGQSFASRKRRVSSFDSARFQGIKDIREMHLG